MNAVYPQIYISITEIFPDPFEPSVCETISTLLEVIADSTSYNIEHAKLVIIYLIIKFRVGNNEEK